MSDSNEIESTETADDNGTADAIAALGILTIAVLAAINYVYTGGLSAFIASVI